MLVRYKRRQGERHNPRNTLGLDKTPCAFATTLSRCSPDITRAWLRRRNRRLTLRQLRQCFINITWPLRLLTCWMKSVLVPDSFRSYQSATSVSLIQSNFVVVVVVTIPNIFHHHNNNDIGIIKQAAAIICSLAAVQQSTPRSTTAAATCSLVDGRAYC